VIHKLPVGIQNKWRDRAISYKKQSNTVFPPFSFFCTFIQEIGWKSTFKDVMYEIKASPIEELDLLIRYLGKSSSRQVSRIKASNPGNPKLGLEKA
jgi:hypothetical protein